MNNSARASAPAKINLLFSVGALKPDGYHDVASVYHALDIREQVETTPAENWNVAISGKISDSQIDSIPVNEENLVIRAANQIAKTAALGSAKPIDFRISKNIPVAGGLAGGSADAAAALVAINEMWCTGLSSAQLQAAAAALGADIPFSLIGGSAIGLGRGEELQPIEGVPNFYWVLVFSEIGLSTPMIYRKLDEIRTSRGEDISAPRELRVDDELISALKSGDAKSLAKQLRNDLQEAAIAIRPELAAILDAGEDAGALAGIVSGSGPTVVFLAESADKSEKVAAILRASGFDAVAATGPAAGTRLEQ